MDDHRSGSVVGRPARPRVVDLGRLGYSEAYEAQLEHHADVLAGRAEGQDRSRLLLVEHDPVITVSRRPGAAGHVLASDAALAAAGVERVETDRGGDVTYHGPGQLVCYPILDLNTFGFRLHDYMRFLEDVVIATLGRLGVRGVRDPEATGVWVEREAGLAKVCAMGVRVRRWVSMHGLALNVRPDLEHFGLIVPCGLEGRAVTSLGELLGERTPSMVHVGGVLTGEMWSALDARLAARGAARGYGASGATMSPRSSAGSD